MIGSGLMMATKPTNLSGGTGNAKRRLRTSGLPVPVQKNHKTDLCVTASAAKTKTKTNRESKVDEKSENVRKKKGINPAAKVTSAACTGIGEEHEVCSTGSVLSPEHRQRVGGSKLHMLMKKQKPSSSSAPQQSMPPPDRTDISNYRHRQALVNTSDDKGIHDNARSKDLPVKASDSSRQSTPVHQYRKKQHQAKFNLSGSQLDCQTPHTSRPYTTNSTATSHGQHLHHRQLSPAGREGLKNSNKNRVYTSSPNKHCDDRWSYPAKSRIPSKQPIHNTRWSYPETPVRRDSLNAPGLSQDRLHTPASRDRLSVPASRDRLNTRVSQDRLNTPTSQDRLNTRVSQDRLNTPTSQDRLNTRVSQDRLNTSTSRDRFNTRVSQDRLNTSVTQNRINTPIIHHRLKTPTVQGNVQRPVSHEGINIPVAPDRLNSHLSHKNVNSHVLQDRINSSAAQTSHSNTYVIRSSHNTPVTDEPVSPISPNTPLSQNSPNTPTSCKNIDTPVTQDSLNTSVSQNRLDTPVLHDRLITPITWNSVNTSISEDCPSIPEREDSLHIDALLHRTSQSAGAVSPSQVTTDALFAGRSESRTTHSVVHVTAGNHTPSISASPCQHRRYSPDLPVKTADQVHRHTPGDRSPVRDVNSKLSKSTSHQHIPHVRETAFNKKSGRQSERLKQSKDTICSLFEADAKDLQSKINLDTSSPNTSSFFKPYRAVNICQHATGKHSVQGIPCTSAGDIVHHTSVFEHDSIQHSTGQPYELCTPESGENAQSGEVQVETVGSSGVSPPLKLQGTKKINGMKINYSVTAQENSHRLKSAIESASCHSVCQTQRDDAENATDKELCKLAGYIQKSTEVNYAKTRQLKTCTSRANKSSNCATPQVKNYAKHSTQHTPQSPDVQRVNRREIVVYCENKQLSPSTPLSGEGGDTNQPERPHAENRQVHPSKSGPITQGALTPNLSDTPENNKKQTKQTPGVKQLKQFSLFNRSKKSGIPSPQKIVTSRNGVPAGADKDTQGNAKTDRNVKNNPKTYSAATASALPVSVHNHHGNKDEKANKVKLNTTLSENKLNSTGIDKSAPKDSPSSVHVQRKNIHASAVSLQTKDVAQRHIPLNRGSKLKISNSKISLSGVNEREQAVKPGSHLPSPTTNANQYATYKVADHNKLVKQNSQQHNDNAKSTKQNKSNPPNTPQTVKGNAIIQPIKCGSLLQSPLHGNNARKQCENRVSEKSSPGKPPHSKPTSPGAIRGKQIKSSISGSKVDRKRDSSSGPEVDCDSNCRDLHQCDLHKLQQVTVCHEKTSETSGEAKHFNRGGCGGGRVLNGAGRTNSGEGGGAHQSDASVKTRSPFMGRKLPLTDKYNVLSSSPQHTKQTHANASTNNPSVQSEVQGVSNSTAQLTQKLETEAVITVKCDGKEDVVAPIPRKQSVSERVVSRLNELFQSFRAGSKPPPHLSKLASQGLFKLGVNAESGNSQTFTISGPETKKIQITFSPKSKKREIPPVKNSTESEEKTEMQSVLTSPVKSDDSNPCELQLGIEAEGYCTPKQLERDVNMANALPCRRALDRVLSNPRLREQIQCTSAYLSTDTSTNKNKSIISTCATTTTTITSTIIIDSYHYRPQKPVASTDSVDVTSAKVSHLEQGEATDKLIEQIAVDDDLNRNTLQADIIDSIAEEGEGDARCQDSDFKGVPGCGKRIIQNLVYNEETRRDHIDVAASVSGNVPRNTCENENNTHRKGVIKCEDTGEKVVNENHESPAQVFSRKDGVRDSTDMESSQACHISDVEKTRFYSDQLDDSHNSFIQVSKSPLPCVRIKQANSGKEDKVQTTKHLNKMDERKEVTVDRNFCSLQSEIGHEADISSMHFKSAVNKTGSCVNDALTSVSSDTFLNDTSACSSLLTPVTGNVNYKCLPVIAEQCFERGDTAPCDGLQENTESEKFPVQTGESETEGMNKCDSVNENGAIEGENGDPTGTVDKQSAVSASSEDERDSGGDNTRCAESIVTNLTLPTKTPNSSCDTEGELENQDITHGIIEQANQACNGEHNVKSELSTESVQVQQRIPTKKRYSYRAAIDSSWGLPDEDEQDSDLDMSSDDSSDVFTEPSLVTVSEMLGRCINLAGGQTGHGNSPFAQHDTQQFHHYGNQKNKRQPYVSPSGHSVTTYDYGRIGSRLYDRSRYKAVNHRMPQSAFTASSSSHCHPGAGILTGQGNISESIVANDSIHNVHMNDKICIIEMDGKAENENNNNTYICSNRTIISSVDNEPSEIHENSTLQSLDRNQATTITDSHSNSHSSTEADVPTSTSTISKKSAGCEKSTQVDARVQPTLRSVSTPSLRLEKMQTKLPKYKTTSTLSKTAVIRRTSSVVKRSSQLAHTTADEQSHASHSLHKPRDATSSLQNPPHLSGSNANQSTNTQTVLDDNNTASGLDNSVHFVEYQQQSSENASASSLTAENPQNKDCVNESAEFKQAKQFVQVSSSSRIKQVTTYGRIIYKPQTGISQTPFTNLEGGSQTAMQRLFANRNSPKNPINPTSHNKHTKSGGRYLGQRSRSVTELLLHKQLQLMSQDLVDAAAVNAKTAGGEDAAEEKQNAAAKGGAALSQFEGNASTEESGAVLSHTVGNVSVEAVNSSGDNTKADQKLCKDETPAWCAAINIDSTVQPVPGVDTGQQGDSSVDDQEYTGGWQSQKVCVNSVNSGQVNKKCGGSDGAVQGTTESSQQNISAQGKDGMPPWSKETFTKTPRNGQALDNQVGHTEVTMDNSARSTLAYKLWKQIGPSGERSGTSDGKKTFSKSRPKSADFSMVFDDVADTKSSTQRPKTVRHRTHSVEAEIRNTSSKLPIDSVRPSSPGIGSAGRLHQFFGSRQSNKDKKRQAYVKRGSLDPFDQDDNQVKKSDGAEPEKPEKVVKLKRYNSISKHEDLNTLNIDQCPPLARFSSSEDIDSCPTSPVGVSPRAEKRNVATSEQGRHRSSPHSLEKQLSKLLMQVSTKTDPSASGAMATDSAVESSDTSHQPQSLPVSPVYPKPVKLYAAHQHHSMPVPMVTVDQSDAVCNQNMTKFGFMSSQSDNSSVSSSTTSVNFLSGAEPMDEVDEVRAYFAGLGQNRKVQSLPRPLQHSTSAGENVVLRHSPSKVRERPKSDCLTVRWDKSVKQELNRNRKIPQNRRRLRVRPKSDLGDAKAISEALRKYEMKETSDRLTELGAGELMSHMCSKPRSRRMSTPHPIKTRIERTPPVKQKIHSKGTLSRVKSAPELDKVTCKKCYSITMSASSDHAGDLAVRKDVLSDEDSSEDTLSLGSCSVSSKLTFDEMFDEETATYAEALWDHVTMDPEELPFSAHDLIEVTDMTDKDWWWGVKDEYQGWFPAAFVRLRANQAETAEDFVEMMREGTLDTSRAIKRHNTSFVSKDQARTNVVNEIIHAEREYVRHLKDVVEGYVEKARRRPEMFSEERISTIFGNIEEIYLFSKRFLAELEGCIVCEDMHLSEIGHCFVNQSKGFEIYSEYCNNHPLACKELKLLLKDAKYQQFFEACRLLQQMIEIPLEGFLLIPVQKICKYPLQLAELLKYTRKQHADSEPVRDALHAMKEIAVLINERKRKMESVEKLALWQQTVTDWEGPDLLEKSSELIYAGELNKINPSGWSQERNFFLFDHQLVYCKKELWRDVLLYKGRIDLDNCQIKPIADGKDVQFNVTVKHAWKIYDGVKEKWYLICAKSSTQKSRWLKAFNDERNRVNEDKKNGFNLNPSHRLLRLSGPRRRAHPVKFKGKGSGQSPLDLTAFTTVSSHAALPNHHSNKDPMARHNKKKSWFHFGGKKSKT